MVCGVCGFDNPEGHRFCGACGSGLGAHAPGFCAECTGQVARTDQFCLFCGSSLTPEGARLEKPPSQATKDDLQAEDLSPGSASEPSDVQGLEELEEFAGALEVEGGSESSGEVPTAAMRAPVRLRTVIGPEADELHIMPAEGGQVGRFDECDISLPGDAYVNDEHASFGRDEHGVYVVDLESVNGTFVRVRERFNLKAGDEVKIGQAIFRVEK